MTNTTRPAWMTGLDMTASCRLEKLVAQPVTELAVYSRVEHAVAVRREQNLRWFGTAELPAQRGNHSRQWARAFVEAAS